MNGAKTECLTPARPDALPSMAVVGLRIFAGVTLMALAAQVRFPVPGTEVPATLQSFALLLVAFTLRPVEAFSSMIAYLAIGFCGLPVFAAALPGTLGSTSGFLLGFAVTAPLVALMSGRSSGFRRLMFSGLLGFAVLFMIGNLWRWGYWSQVDGREVSLGAMLATGLLPFVPKALVEVFLAALLVSNMRRGRGGQS